MNIISKIFYPKNFLFLSMALLFMSVLLLSISLYCIFNLVPDDELQGSLVKIMYIHVPSAWLSLFLYFIFSVFSLLYLIKDSPLFDMAATSIAYVCICMTSIAILTGAIWGKPAWGTWWVWDARLTSMLILFFILAGYFAIRDFFNDEARSASIGAIFAIIGAVNIPIIKFSVNLWSTLHQPSSIIRASGPSIHASMLYPIFSMFLGILFFCSLIVLIKMNTKIYQKKSIAKYARKLGSTLKNTAFRTQNTQ